MPQGYLTRFTKIKTGEKIIDQTIDSVDLVFGDIATREIINGQLIENISIPTGSVVRVSHGLQRPLKGWIVVKQNANSSIWDSENSNSQKTQFLLLNSSANVTVSLWVF